ncbi:hypothetical protein PAHAL_9G011100 [Panicum hallii]|jgi:hypothetical protein|uniref:Nucleotide-diphospho-sugar transferase domain-containing protein n=1 Tax=Panicum hallii TaxID=206008 RepID=A0A2S3IGU6_9POAL|nr:uncharacterized protein At4g15970-like [Panicum hallii]PAN44006.1 hypothetical protein PAHAL_9G011100 [Panicum hallii]
MAKVAAEAAGRQAASFVLGCVAALTLVLLLQRRPEELTRPRAPVQFFGSRSLSSPSGRGGGGTSPSSPPSAPAGPAAIVAAADGQLQTAVPVQANATKLMKPAAAGATTTAATADDLGRVPATPAHRQQEGEADDAEFPGLAAVVARAATPDDRTVIITCVNHAWAAPGSLLDLFLESFRVGDGIADLLDHVLIVAMDPMAMARCRALHPHCYLYTMPGIDFASAKFFLSKEYLELVWSKLKLQRRVLQLGYNFLFTDVDILWFRNPFKHVTAYADMSISSDVFFGDPDNMDNFPNTGFFHVRPNKRTIAMTRAWHEARERYPGRNEQPVFNAIKKGLVRDLRLRLQYMDPAFMGGFCSYGKDLRRICTMHANCCVGLGNKLRDLRTLLADWRNYTAMPHWAKQHAKWTVPGACIH